jgi:hypothetical protein
MLLIELPIESILENIRDRQQHVMIKMKQEAFNKVSNFLPGGQKLQVRKYSRNIKVPRPPG